MEIILLEKVKNLGNLGDKVSVKSGYGRNFLIPQGKAVIASAKKIAEFEVRRADLEKAAAETLAAAQKRADALNGKTFTVTAHAGEEGRLFGSVGTTDIADAISAAGEKVCKSEIRLPTGALRTVGEYEVAVHLHADVDCNVIISVVAG